MSYQLQPVAKGHQLDESLRISRGSRGTRDLNIMSVS